MTLTVVGVAVAGAIGSLVRNEVTGRCATRYRAGRAIGTAIVNLFGSTLLAIVVALHVAGAVGDRFLLVAGLGFCGSLTTFSTWLVEAVVALRRGERSPVAVLGVEVVGHLAVGVLLAAAVLALR